MNLNVNIDHIATLRNARGGAEPDPIAGAILAEIAGATGIVAHLREDRRHIKDNDIKRLRESIQTRLDLEMAATDEIINFALDIKPELVTIVPEKRMELTTEGGLDVLKDIDRFRILCDKMHSKNIEVSFFIEPDISQIDACSEIGADMVELHTGKYAEANDEKLRIKLAKDIEIASNYAVNKGLNVAAGHGLNYFNVSKVAAIDSIREYSIGHSIISRSIFVGMTQAVKEMLEILRLSRMEASIK